MSREKNSLVIPKIKMWLSHLRTVFLKESGQNIPMKQQVTCDAKYLVILFPPIIGSIICLLIEINNE